MIFLTALISEVGGTFQVTVVSEIFWSSSRLKSVLEREAED